MLDTPTPTDTKTFYVLFDEIEGGYVGTRFLGSSHRELLAPLRERIEYYPDYTDFRVVRFNSEVAANNWFAPNEGYDRSRATLVRVAVTYAAEAV